MASTLAIDIQYASPAIEKNIKSIVSSITIKKWVKETTQHSGSLTLRFVNQAEGKKLNAAFRKKDAATNVLTFPYELTKKTVAADIIFCFPVIQKEAREQGKTVKAHLAHLVVHGCLHAQGFDHEIEKEAKKMENREIALLKLLGFTNPY
ncbi:rRNA maturation RNase YbeY [Polynucleobacter antarcticus]|uniref:Endoribonuclease YbeY n=1 Tax=Polynucleobacter antarcticus TaxID=1743162 RepID=A0A6M9PU21_9BURK|nr:rRNA maturation RNase YbeY [Polynucleobacter antarcticus]QKM63342.1 rRNA maturation RNase YbeY [Polynucleobacter antarcticus]